MIELLIPLAPYPMPRPRHMRNGHTFTPKEALEQRGAFRLAMIKQTPGRPLLEGPLSVDLCFVRLPGRIGAGECPCCGLTFADVEAHMDRKHPGQRRAVPTGARQRADGDNFEKFMFDAANGVLWVDDRQVVECHWVLRDAKEDEEAHVEMTVRPA
jgi:Holliday junction resolvase RusA-like endonuclease